jgi:hypothetical protein
MARYTLFPGTGDAQIDGYLAQDVDYVGIDPTIHCVQWYDTIGQIEYVGDVMTGAKPQNEDITDITPYLPYITSAQAIIDAYLNPQIFYSTSDSTLFNGSTVPLGNEIAITTVGGIPPATTTDLVPPTPEDFQTLYWFNDSEWVVSGVNPNLNLAAAQANLITQIQTSATEQADLQARIYSMYQLSIEASPGTLPTADYAGIDLDTYQAYIDGEVSAMTATVNAATTVPQLYSFDWRVEGDPNA